MSKEKEVTVNRTYKARIFAMIFSDKIRNIQHG